MPTQIYFGSLGNITYIYNALGQKVKKTVLEEGKTNATDYLDGYQYLNTYLKFFPTAEGYVNAYQDTGIILQGSYLFNYVYSYTDHLGNIRLSYAKDPKTQTLKILEQNHYYPFGLKHENYNSERRVFAKEEAAAQAQQAEPNPDVQILMVGIGGSNNNNAAMKIIPGNGGGTVVYGERNYKYQGQERQDELGLNWDSFKWRNYDYAIGRFMSIDPLAMEYTYNSPYAFQENKMGMGRELEGLELHYSSPSEIVNNTGFRPMVNAVKSIGNSFMSLFSSSKPETKKVSTETTNVSLSTDNGGNENPTTTGPALDFMNVTSVIENMGSFAGLPGGKSKNGMTDTKTSNMLSNVKEKTELFKEGKEAATSTGKATDAIKTEVGNYGTKTTYTNGQVHTASKTGNEAQIKTDSLNLTETKAAGSAVKSVEIIR